MAAYEEARVLALRGLDFDSIVERLEREKGLDTHTARAAAARHSRPIPRLPSAWRPSWRRSPDGWTGR